MAPLVSREAVLTELSSILASRQFATAGRLTAFLQHIVEKTLDGRAEDIKEYTIAIEVFGKPESFDPRLDTIVRVQGSKLRSKLKEYYAGEGANDRVVIDLPRGSYVPVFQPVLPPDLDVPKEPVPANARNVPKWAIFATVTLGIGVLAWSILHFLPRRPLNASAHRKTRSISVTARRRRLPPRFPKSKVSGLWPAPQPSL